MEDAYNMGLEFAAQVQWRTAWTREQPFEMFMLVHPRTDDLQKDRLLMRMFNLKPCCSHQHSTGKIVSHFKEVTAVTSNPMFFASLRLVAARLKLGNLWSERCLAQLRKALLLNASINSAIPLVNVVCSGLA